MNGCFISIEGIDGAGKSTQAQRLAEALRQEGVSVVLTKEPGGTRVGEAIRSLLLDPAIELTPWAEAFLYLSDRAQHVAEVVRPALATGQCVITERFADSTLAYQCFGRGLDFALIRRLNQEVTQGVEPRLIILLDVPPDVGAGRRETYDRIEGEGHSLHTRVREGYLALAADAPGRFRVIDGTRDTDTVAVEVHAAVRPLVARGVER